jgi:hypothetical protein
MKKNTVLYMNKVGTLPAKAKPVISINIGKLIVVKVPVGSSEGWLNELVVRQVSGTAKAFDIEVLDSVVPFPVGESNYNATPAATLDLFRVINKIAVTSGATGVLRESEMGYSYQNADGGPTSNEPYLYLVIIPTNSTDVTTWEVAFTTSREVY